MMKKYKEIIIEFVDEDFSKLLKEENRKKFLSELESLELKYSVENIEKYAKYLNEELQFPLTAYYTIDNGMFGIEKVQIEIEKIIENKSKQGVKCSCKVSGNAIRKIPLHLIEMDETNKYKDIINHYKDWYFKNHKK
ncbi:MAG TPA: hypothetical protein VKA34_04175 [Balneolales bacterium]|nr:hypothetical protein [Balneolales bacterium]